MIEIRNNINKREDSKIEESKLKKIYRIYSFLDRDTYKVVNDTLLSKGISPDMVKETDDKYLISFTLDRKPDSSILTCSKSEWIVDEYNEIELYDGTGSGDFKFEKAVLYKVNSQNIPLSQTFDDFDSLFMIHPVHYGEIRIMELNHQIERLKERIDRIEHNISLPKSEESERKDKQHWITDMAILKHKIKVNLNEISFIRNLWETLNNELYGYDDKNFASRYRGIDPLSLSLNFKL